MSKFLIVSAVAESLGLAIRLQMEGHEVKMFINSKEEDDVGDGLVEKSTDWRKDSEWADLIYFDDCYQKHNGDKPYESDKWSQELIDKDKLVIGGGQEEVAKLENDRLFGMDILKEYGAPYSELHQFKNFEEARKFLQEDGGDYALKWNSQVDRDASTVGSSKEVIEFLTYLEKNWGELGNNEPIDFVLQPKADGIEIAMTAFFDGSRFHKEAIYMNQEFKKELNDNMGRSTGQMGEIGIMKNNPKLFRESLSKIEPFLKDKGYCGFIDLNCIINGVKIVPLEFTARPGYPTVFSFLNLLDEPAGEWLIRMAQQDKKGIDVSEAYNCTIVITSATFPDQSPERAKMCIINLPEIEDSEDKNKVGYKNLWLCEIRAEDDKLMGAGSMGYLAVLTTRGPEIFMASHIAYETIECIKVTPYKKIRTDIGKPGTKVGDQCYEDFQKLKHMGWFN